MSNVVNFDKQRRELFEAERKTLKSARKKLLRLERHIIRTGYADKLAKR